MKYKCPYCAKNLGEKVSTHCPECGKVMRIPGHYKHKKKAKSANKNRTESLGSQPPLNPSLLTGTKTQRALIAIASLAVVAVVLLARVSVVTTSDPDRYIIKAAKETDNMMTACDQFKIHVGRYPTEQEGLKALVTNPGIEKWDGHYITYLRPDPWKRNYIYRLSNEVAVVKSSGPDMKDNTADDIYGTSFIVSYTNRIHQARTERLLKEETAEKSRRLRVARDAADILISACDLFKEDTGRYPSNEEGFTALVDNPGIESWNGYYVKELKNDPWGKPYIYSLSNGTAVVKSLGPDLTENTDDDITGIPFSSPADNRAESK